MIEKYIDEIKEAARAAQYIADIFDDMVEQPTYYDRFNGAVEAASDRIYGYWGIIASVVHEVEDTR